MSPNGQETIGLTLHVDMYRKLFPAEYMKKCIANNVRPDARDLNAFRSVNVNTNVIQTASSSSLVKFGKTSVLTAAKLAVGTPAVATPDQGEIGLWSLRFLQSYLSTKQHVI
jgi:exosome complex component RRP43